MDFGVFKVGFLIVFETSLSLSLTQKMRLACCLGHIVQIQGSTTKGIRSTAVFRNPAFTRALCVNLGLTNDFCRKRMLFPAVEGRCTKANYETSVEL